MARARVCLKCKLPFVGERPRCPSCEAGTYRNGEPWGSLALAPDLAKAKQIHLELLEHGDLEMEPMPALGFAETRKEYLRRWEVALQVAVSDLLIDAECTQRDSAVLGGYTRSARFDIRGYLWAENEAVRRIKIRVPATWWQHFKDRFFRGWMRKRWPVRYTEHVVDVEAIYPEFKQKMPRSQCGQAVLVLNYGAPREFSA